jgi:putative ABC transport system permease protein
MIALRRFVARRPFVLLHFGAVFVAVAVATAILVAAAAGGPLFSSVTGTAAVATAIDGRTESALVISKMGPITPDVVALRDRAVSDAIGGMEDLGAPIETLIGSPLRLEHRPGGDVHALVASKPDLAAHATLVAGSSGEPGIWLSESASETIGATVGDRVTLEGGGRSVEGIPVAAIYRASRTDPYWAPLFAATEAPRPTELVPIDREGFLRIETGLELAGTQAWTFPLTQTSAQGLSLDRAIALGDQLRAMERSSADPRTEFGATLSDPDVSSPVTDAATAAEAGRALIASSTGTLAVTGGIVALLGVAAAGVYGVRRRRMEMRWLDARGITRGRLAAGATAESILPVAVGAIVGWIGTWLTVHSFGPASIIEPSAIEASLVGSAVASLLAIAVLASVTVTSGRRQARQGTTIAGERPSAPLWEVPALVLAAAALYEIGTRGTSAVSTAGGEVRVDRLVLLFPILFMAGCSGLAVRGLSRILPRARGTGRWPTFLYLAARRVTSAPRAATILVAAAALAIGVVSYASSAVGTVRAVVRDKVYVDVGAEVSASMPAPALAPPPDTPITITNVFRIGDVPSGAGRVTVMGVDAGSFADVALWDGAFSSVPLPTLMDRIAGPARGPLPVIVVGANAAGAPTSVMLAGYTVPLTAVGTATAFPGQEQGPTVVVDADGLRSILERHGASIGLRGAHNETWARGDPMVARAFLLSSGADPASITTAADRLDTPAYRSLAWSFVFMELIAIVTGVIALIGVLLYLQARQRARDISYALMRRMGLSARTHRAAVIAEVSTLLAAAYVIGSLCALAAAALVYQRLDPLPGSPPGPVLVFPVGAAIGTAAVVVACAWLGGGWVQRRAAHAHVGRELRFAG